MTITDTVDTSTTTTPTKTREELIARTIAETGCTTKAAEAHYDFWLGILEGGFTDETLRRRTLTHYEMGPIHDIMYSVMPDDTASAPGTLHREFEEHFTALLPTPDQEGRIQLLHTSHDDNCGADCAWRMEGELS